MLNNIKTKLIQVFKSKFFISLWQNIVNFVRSHKRTVILVSILTVVAIAFVITLWQLKVFPFDGSVKNPFQQKSTTPTFTPRPIPHGPKGFSVGQSDKTIPQFGRGEINPYDPAKGTDQLVSIVVKHTSPITKVTGMLRTDDGDMSPVDFTLVSGTNTNGTWQGSWKVTKSYLYIYQLVFTATGSDKKRTTVVVTLR